MSWFWRRAAKPEDVVAACGGQLRRAVVQAVKVGRFARVEDLIAVAASVVGEASIAAAGEFDPRRHPFEPGSPILSDKVNEVLSGNVAAAGLDAIPAGSVIGMLRDGACAAGYSSADFPPLDAVCRNFVSGIGREEEWAAVPLSVPPEHVPFKGPLLTAFQMRPTVDRICRPLDTADQRLRSCVLALVSVLALVKQAIDNKVALLLALETVNGVAKTAPLTDEALRSLEARFARGSAAKP